MKSLLYPVVLIALGAVLIHYDTGSYLMEIVCGLAGVVLIGIGAVVSCKPE